MSTEVKDKTEEKKALSLDDIAKLGYVTKTKEIFKGVTATFQTLSHSRQQQILTNLPANNIEQLARYNKMQVETLVHATIKINDESYTEKDVEFLRDWYSKLQNKVLIEFYAAYLELSEEQDNILEELKKK